MFDIANALIGQSGALLVLFSVIVFEIPRYLFSTLALALDGMRHRRDAARSPRPGTVSVVIPVSNDAANILQTIAHVRNVTVAPCEIIVVDDGSTDGTAGILAEAKRKGLVDLVITHASRSGKSAASNHAARFARGDFLLFLDSDTLVQPDSVGALLAAFASRSVAAATGNLAPSNKDESLTTSVQAVEYLVSITGGRSFLEAFGANACCAGAFTMFRASVFRQVGGFDVGPGEDLELTLRLRRLGHGVKFVPAALALVEVPKSVGRLLAQRARWDRDAISIRLFRYHQQALRNPGESASDTFMRLDFLVFDVIPTIVFPGYVIYLVSHFGADAAWVFLGVYVYVAALSFVNLAISVATLPVRLNLFDAAAVLAVPIYQGLLLRLARFVAFVSEALFARSRHDDFVPARVRRALYGEA